MTDMYAAVHEIKPKYSKSFMKKAKEMLGDPKEFENSFNEVVPFFGGVPEGLPDDLRSNIQYAEELKSKMKIN